MYLEYNQIKLSPDKRNNLIRHEDNYYQVDFLRNDNEYAQGSNGMVFKLTDEQEDKVYAIKFFKHSEQARNKDSRIEKKARRFEREIEALSIATTNELNNVVELFFYGVHQIEGLDFQYFVMQKCDCNLMEYLAENDLDTNQKTLLCYKILLGIQGLHNYKIYHRDIKHTNIFFIGSEPYIGDLGLALLRSKIWINERGELIGPTGWFSPEAINKYLLEKIKNPNNHNIIIDEKSEIFQLGKLFWYIYLGTIPIGQIEFSDFISNEKNLFEILFNMLLYSKENRWNSDNVLYELNSYLSSN